MQRIYKSYVLDLTLVVVCLYSVFFILHKFDGGKIPFWDFHVHYCAAKNFYMGYFPYGINVLDNCLHPNIKLNPNFPPLTLEFLKYLGTLNLSAASFLWICFEIFSLFLIFYLFKKVFKFDYEIRNFFIFIFSFGATIFISFLSGNLSLILYGLLSLGLIFLYQKKDNYYYLIVLSVSFFKFYYLSFLVIPFYLFGIKSLKKISFVVFLFIFVQYLSYIRNPELTLAFLEVIQGKYQDVLPTRMLTGTGLYSIIEKFPWVINFIVNGFDLEKINFTISFFSLKINLLIWAFVSSVILFSIFYCLNLERIKKSNKHFMFCLSFGVLSINLLIPRLVGYDMILTIPIFFYLLNQINFNRIKFKNFNLKYILIFIFLILFDHHFPFLTVSSFVTLFIYSEFYKKNFFSY